MQVTWSGVHVKLGVEMIRCACDNQVIRCASDMIRCASDMVRCACDMVR